MGQKILVDSVIKDSAKLIANLDASGTRLNFAGWYFYPEIEEWRLLLASTGLDKILKTSEEQAYRIVIEQLQKLNSTLISISDLKLVSTDDNFLKVMKSLIQTSPAGVGHVRFSNTNMNGVFIADVSVLRSFWGTFPS